MAAVRKEIGFLEKPTSLEFLPFVNERSPTGKLLKHNRSISFDKTPDRLPKLKTDRLKTRDLQLPPRYSGGVPAVGQYDAVPMDRYKTKSPVHKISQVSRSMTRLSPMPPPQEKPNLVQSSTMPKYFLKLPFKAHLQSLTPINLTNYLPHKSPIGEVECPAFPANFMHIGKTQQHTIKTSLKDIRQLKQELKRKLFRQLSPRKQSESSFH